jgi:photosystem II stability/assembly factor-like uncharacterized protein
LANKGGTGHLQFRRPGEGWLADAGESGPAVYSTVDGGASWQRHALPTPTEPNLAVDTFVGLVPGVGVIVYIDYGIATKSLAYTSFDVGNTWRSVTPPPNTPAQNVTFQDSTHWWATGSGTVWKSSDAGQSWTSVYQKFDKWVEGPQFIDAKHGWAQLYVPGKSARPPSGLAMTSDGGLRWTQVDAPGPQ